MSLILLTISTYMYVGADMDINNFIVYFCLDKLQLIAPDGIN